MSDYCKQCLRYEKCDNSNCCEKAYRRGGEDVTNDLREELRQFVSWLSTFYAEHDYCIVKDMHTPGRLDYEELLIEDDEEELFGIIDKYLEDKENGNEDKV